jgi:[ribosomal protein S18]-alanine N-acetyltransferase
MQLDGLPFTLQRMRLGDLATVSQIERQVFATPWSIQAYRQELLFHQAATYLVLRYVGKPGVDAPTLRRPWGTRQDPTLLGYGGVWMVLDEAHISTLAVRPTWRGRGLGELILAGLVESALNQKAELVTLEVRKSNRAAQNLYVKYGFAEAGMRRRYYPDNQEDALIMNTPPIQTETYRALYRERVDGLLARLRGHCHTPPAGTRELRGP